MFEEYPSILDVASASRALGIGKTTLYALLRTGEIRSVKVGRKIKIPKAYLIEYIADQAMKTSTNT